MISKINKVKEVIIKLLKSGDATTLSLIEMSSYLRSVDCVTVYSALKNLRTTGKIGYRRLYANRGTMGSSSRVYYIAD